MWAEKKKISCGGLIPLKLVLLENFMKICDLKLRIRTNIISWWGCALAATPKGHPLKAAETAARIH